MESLFRILEIPHTCTYLPEQEARLEYERFLDISAEEYARRLQEGWRRFGFTVFRPRCLGCKACLSLRVPVGRFRPNRSQRRTRQANADLVLRIGRPRVTRDKLALYDRFHEFQADRKGWPDHGPKDVDGYVDSFVQHPFATEEWCYFLNERLVGVGYVDALPVGLSAIYFFWEPKLKSRGLGTNNVLCILEEAARRGLPHVYLGYYVEGCRSLEYKAGFRPNEVIGPDGKWRDFAK